MSDPIKPRLPTWPFLLGDVLLLGVAGFIAFQSHPPLDPWEMTACGLCVALGAVFGTLPFLLQYRTDAKLAEAASLSGVASRIQRLDEVAAQIGEATARWQTVQESADRTAGVAREIAEGMGAELKAFNEFLQRANDGEKGTLRLEVDKLRRAEGDWLQALVRMLDHIHAVYQAGLRSRQSALIDQLGQFQNNCRDAARRVGITVITASQGEAFDAQRHQTAEEAANPPANSVVEEMLATGYSFQGKLLRPALVRLQPAHGLEAIINPAGGEPSMHSSQSQLPLPGSR